MRGGCCAPKHPSRQKQHRWAALVFPPNLMTLIRSALVSEEIHWQKSSCTTEANNLQLWERKPCQEVQLPVSHEQMPLLCYLWKYSSIIVFFPSGSYSHRFMSPPLFWESLVLHGDSNSSVRALFSTTKLWEVAVFETSPLFGKLVTGIMTQVPFNANYTWAWTVATCAHGGWRRNPDAVFLKKKGLWEQSDFYWKDSTEMNASNVISIIH